MFSINKLVKNALDSVRGFLSNPANPVSRVIQKVTNGQSSSFIDAAQKTAAAQRAQEQAAAAARARTEKQNQVNSAVNSARNFFLGAAKTASKFIERPRTKAAAQIKNVDWRKHFNDDGSLRNGLPYYDGASFYSPEVVAARNNYNKWVNATKKISNEGTYDQIRSNYESRAKSLVDKRKNAGAPRDFFGSIFDKATFGGTRRAVSARDFAASQKNTVAKEQIKRYEDSTKAFLQSQAKKRAEIQNKKFSTRAEYDSTVAQYELWERNELNRLEYMRAATDGLISGYGIKSTEKLTNLPGKIGNWLNDNVVQGGVGNIAGNVWKYTLGAGDKDLPSLVTAPSRLINYFGNALDPNRTIYKADGTQEKLNAAQNAWQKTFGQRNFNMTPYTQAKYSKAAAIESMKRGGTGGVQSMALIAQYKKAKTEKEKDVILRKFWDEQNRAGVNDNNFREFLADPLNLFGAAKIPKVAEWGGKILPKVAKTPVGKFFESATQKVKDNSVVKWLNSEAKNPQQIFRDEITAAKTGRAELAAKWFPQYKELMKNSQNRPWSDLGVIDEVTANDFIAAALQRSKNGKLSARDRIALFGRSNKMERARIEQLIQRYRTFTDEQAGFDMIDESASRFLGKKATKQYVPRTTYFRIKGRSLDDYDFRLKKNSKRIQSATDLKTSLTDRLFKSDFEDWHNVAKGKADEADWTLSKMKREYAEQSAESERRINEAYQKTQTKTAKLRRTAERLNPMSFWKKSVLKYRPAWYVNNFLYNTQAAGLAGGGNALIEQAKLLRPKNFRAAMNEIPPELKTKLANEVGGGRLSKFASNLENLSRVAAYRALKKKGATDKEALKRVNRYLFDYTTKNYERPLKTIVPFYQFQKGLTKAAVQLPFDKPLAALAYNKLDEYQQQQFQTDFDSIVPKLRELGYSDDEIAQIKAEQQKYYAGRLKVGDNYYTTPFNSFSEKGLTNTSINPFIAAAGETASSTDSFGRSTTNASLRNRVLSKFPQYELGKKAVNKFLVKSGKLKPTENWIGKPGSEGYGMTKEAQGYDPSKANYRQNLDPSAKLKQDLLAFMGVPRGMNFDTNKLLERKTMEKLKNEYFSTDFNGLDYAAAEAKRQSIFKKYGVSADQFYKGELAKYDTDSAKSIKAMKEDARAKNKALFDEYSKQPYGTRTKWAANKLKELTSTGYFDKNPFLKSFDWLDPDNVNKAIFGPKRQSPYRYDGKFFKTAESMQKYKKFKLAEKARSTGDWSEYRAVYGTTDKHSAFEHDGKFFKTAESMQKYIDGQFWRRYADASKSERKKLLSQNPKYDTRKDWTTEKWDAWKLEQRKLLRDKASTLSGFAGRYNANITANRAGAKTFMVSKAANRNKKLVYNFK